MIEVLQKPKKQKSSPAERFGFTDISGATEITGLSKSALYKMSAQQKLPCYKPSGKLLFKISELIAWIEESKN